MEKSQISRRRFLRGSVTTGIAVTSIGGTPQIGHAEQRKTLQVRTSPDDGNSTYRVQTTGTMYEAGEVEDNDIIDGHEIEGHLNPGGIDIYEYTGRIKQGFFRGTGSIELVCSEGEFKNDADGQLNILGYGISGTSDYEFTASFGVYESKDGSIESNDRIVTTDSAEGVIGGQEDHWRITGEVTRFGVQLRKRPVYFEHTM